MDHVGGNGMNAGFGKNVSDSIGGCVGFATAYVSSAIKNTAREIGRFYGIKIDYNYIGEAKQRQVLQDFIA
jgi:hypothetical protein